MNQVSTLFMRGVVILIGIAVLALSVVMFPWIVGIAAKIGSEIREGISSEWLGIVVEIGPELAFLQYTSLFGLYAAAIPFFFALYQTLKLLGYIDKNKAFSELSVKALTNIKYCAMTIAILYVAGVIPVIYLIAEVSDAPGILLIGLTIALSPIVIATFSAVLQRLLQEAIDIKSEHDLTV